jgi:exocyst complex component 4
MATGAVTPQRPPRRPGQRLEGRSAGLLVDVVRTLTTSPSPAQKELQKERLEKDFAVTSQTVDRLLTVHQQDLTTSLQSFRKVSSKLATARERVRSVKNNLSSCKSLLHCKREELKQLWLESAEQKHVVLLLERIEYVRSVPLQVSEAINKKRFLHASQLLKNALENIEKSLTDIEGLNEIKDNVRQKSEETFNSILTEIDKQLYIKPSEELLFELRRIASLRKAGGLRTTVDDATSKLSLPGSVKSLSGVYLRASEDDWPLLQDDGYATEDPNDPNPETNPVQFLAVLIEALGFLGKLPDVVDQIKQRIQRGLSKMIQHTTLFD